MLTLRVTGMKPSLSRLNRLWGAQSNDGKKASYYGFSRKFYEFYVELLMADAEALADHFNVAADIDPGKPADATIDPISETMSLTGRVSLQLEPDILARVFLKYSLNGTEVWWTNIVGPRGKMFDPLFREYFNENTEKVAR